MEFFRLGDLSPKETVRPSIHSSYFLLFSELKVDHLCSAVHVAHIQPLKISLRAVGPPVMPRASKIDVHSAA